MQLNEKLFLKQNIYFYSVYFHDWIGRCVQFRLVMMADCWHQQVKI